LSSWAIPAVILPIVAISSLVLSWRRKRATSAADGSAEGLSFAAACGRRSAIAFSPLAIPR
jgi:hypothetical protein